MLQAATYRVVVPVPACVLHGSPVWGPCHARLGREREDETPWEMPPSQSHPGEGSTDLGQRSIKLEGPRMDGVRSAPCSALRTPRPMGTFLGGSPPSSNFTYWLQLCFPRKPRLPQHFLLVLSCKLSPGLCPKDRALPLTALGGPNLVTGSEPVPSRPVPLLRDQALDLLAASPCSATSQGLILPPNPSSPVSTGQAPGSWEAGS